MTTTTTTTEPTVYSTGSAGRAIGRPQHQVRSACALLERLGELRLLRLGQARLIREEDLPVIARELDRQFGALAVAK
jgi:hypothetical protein